MAVSIIGFPFGQPSAGNLPIWKSGTIASEFYLNLENGAPCFLIDATTRHGMSGAPVLKIAQGNYLTESRRNPVISRQCIRFLGVYSAQSEESEIGYVWKPEVIEEILSAIP